MMKKVWLVLLAVVLVFGLALVGCSSGSSGGGDPEPTPFVPFEFPGPGDSWDGIIKPWGSNKPTVTDNEISITHSDSTGFYINFADIGYTLNRSDVIIISYEIDVTTPVAVLTAKNGNASSWGDLGKGGGAGYGKGKGWEYALGDTVRSVYDGPLVASTYDDTTKSGTFELLMNIHSASATAIAFQHNNWADDGGNGIKIADKAVYKLKITKIENKAGEAPPPPPPPPPPTGSEWFDNAVGLTEGIGTYGSGAHEFEGGILTITGNGGFSVPLPTGFTVADTVSIKYACLNVSEDPEADVKFIKKQDSGWTDVGDAEKYPEFNTTEVSTVTVTGFNAAGVGVGKAFFQTNGTFKAKIKIIEITKIEGAPIKITAAVSGLKPVDGEAPRTTVETDQFTGTVSWKDSANAAVTGDFVSGTVYTATITLTKKAGYTFDGVAANAISVTGADTVTHAAGGTGTLSITAVFPVTEGAAPDKTITFTANDTTAVGVFNATVEGVTTNGFTVKTTQGYDWAYGYITVDFGTFTLGDYEKLDFTFTGVTGDINSKSARVWIFDAAPTGQKDQNDAVVSAGNGGTGTVAKPVTVSLEKFSAIASSHVVYVAFNLWSNSGTEFTISGIKFHNTPDE